jgi:hypothetical protein
MVAAQTKAPEYTGRAGKEWSSQTHVDRSEAPYEEDSEEEVKKG